MFPLAIAAAAAKLAKIATAATGPGQKKYTPDSKAPASGIYGCVDCMCLRSNYVRFARRKSDASLRR